jgi:hypothetical protein
VQVEACDGVRTTGIGKLSEENARKHQRCLLNVRRKRYWIAGNFDDAREDAGKRPERIPG